MGKSSHVWNEIQLKFFNSFYVDRLTPGPSLVKAGKTKLISRIIVKIFVRSNSVLIRQGTPPELAGYLFLPGIYLLTSSALGLAQLSRWTREKRCSPAPAIVREFRQWIPNMLAATPWAGKCRRSLVSSPWDSIAGCVGMAKSCAREGLKWTFRTVYVP